MSVALLISNEDYPEHGVYLPIASQSVFDEKWLPIVDSLELKYIPVFGWGDTFNSTHIPVLKKELVLFIQECKNRVDEQEVYADIGERATLLMNKLEELGNIPKHLEFFIG